MARARKRWLALLLGAVLALLGPGAGRPAGAAAGSVDQGFGTGGVVQTDLSGLDVGRDVLVQPDGRTVTIGYVDSGEGVLLRHLVDGRQDPSFGAGGVVRGRPQGAFLQAGALQGDGRIVVVGWNAADDVVVFRYLASGAPDPSFGTGGAVTTDFGGLDVGVDVAVQPDGRIVVLARSGEALALARFLPGGAPDPAFGTGGRTTTAVGPAGTGVEPSALAVLSTGALVVGGQVTTEAGQQSMLLARFTPGGVLDGAFGAGGRVAAADERLTNVAALVVQPGDRIVAAGITGQGHAPVQGLARYLANGSLDPTFGTAGATSRPLGVLSTTADVAVDAAGRLVTAGTVLYSDADSLPGGFSFVAVSRFSADGVVDAAFGCAGSTQVELAAEVGGGATGVAVAPGGRIVVGGIASVDAQTDLGRPDFLLVRLVAEGLPGTGYWITRADGGTSPFGRAGGCGSLRGSPLMAPVVGHAGRPSGDGYWFAAADGGVFTRGDAPFLGSAGALPLRQPIVGMASTPSGRGYWLVAADGGIFAYGDASFLGSTGGLRLDRPILGMASTPSGGGYWLVAADGGIFAFGDAGFFGSTGGLRLDQPVVGMAATATGGGYWLVAADGGIFAFGDAGFLGSTGGIPLDRPVVGMARTTSGNGYWLAAADGGIFTFGDAPFLGSTGGQPFPSPAVAVTRAGP